MSCYRSVMIQQYRFWVATTTQPITNVFWSECSLCSRRWEQEDHAATFRDVKLNKTSDYLLLTRRLSPTTLRICCPNEEHQRQNHPSIQSIMRIQWPNRTTFISWTIFFSFIDPYGMVLFGWPIFNSAFRLCYMILCMVHGDHPYLKLNPKDILGAWLPHEAHLSVNQSMA